MGHKFEGSGLAQNTNMACSNFTISFNEWAEKLKSNMGNDELIGLIDEAKREVGLYFENAFKEQHECDNVDDLAHRATAFFIEKLVEDRKVVDGPEEMGSCSKFKYSKVFELKGVVNDPEREKTDLGYKGSDGEESVEVQRGVELEKDVMQMLSGQGRAPVQGEGPPIGPDPNEAAGGDVGPGRAASVGPSSGPGGVDEAALARMADEILRETTDGLFEEIAERVMNEGEGDSQSPLLSSSTGLEGALSGKNRRKRRKRRGFRVGNALQILALDYDDEEKLDGLEKWMEDLKEKMGHDEDLVRAVDEAYEEVLDLFEEALEELEQPGDDVDDDLVLNEAANPRIGGGTSAVCRNAPEIEAGQGHNEKQAQGDKQENSASETPCTGMEQADGVQQVDNCPQTEPIEKDLIIDTRKSEETPKGKGSRATVNFIEEFTMAIEAIVQGSLGKKERKGKEGGLGSEKAVAAQASVKGVQRGR
nr:hypothetical protein Iba_chr11dCG13650 [Ipomoea batatas]